MKESLVQKAQEARWRLQNLPYNKPVFMCSFGKDSMVLLDLMVSANLNFPVLFHRDPWWPEKYAFADRIIAKYGLEVYDYAPLAVTMWEGKEIMAFTTHYQVGKQANSVLQVPKNILPPEVGKKYLCGLKEVLQRPTGTFNYPWDVAIVGHKNSDKDQIAGAIPLTCDVKLGAGVTPDLVFPLRDWTDEDIWDYTESRKIPVQEDRYDAANRCERDDKRSNSDYAHVCIACIDRRSTARSVMCPKIAMEVSCIPHLVPYVPLAGAGEYYGAPAK
jgi:hypothetical protein